MLKRTTAALFLAALALSSARGADAKPNIVFIMADDLGNADLGYRGGEIKTPNIDKLATSGVRCESFYGMPVCTPARAALMTGRYPMRHGLQTLVIFPSHTYGLPTDERTLPQALKEAGYQTYMVGKWHLGHADEKYWPQNRGFDHFYGNLVGEVDYFTKERGGLIDWQRNGKFFKEEGYFTTLIGNEAVKLIEAQDANKPFFLYFASLAPHAPYQAPKEYIDRYASIQDEKRRTYAGMITALDDQVGRIVAALEQKGLRDNTIILFASDNGGADQCAVRHGRAFRGGAQGEWRRGPWREAAGVQWPFPWRERLALRGGRSGTGVRQLAGQAQAGRGQRTGPHGGRHAHAAGARRWKGGRGSSVRRQGHLATLAEGKPSPHEDILINVEAIRGAIRKGNWKLVKMATFPGKTELFNLADDPEEKHNVADQHPEIVSELNARLIDLCPPAEAERVDQGPAELPWAHRARRSSTPTSTSTTAGCRTRSRTCQPRDSTRLRTAMGVSACETSSTSTPAVDSCSVLHRGFSEAG